MRASVAAPGCRRHAGLAAQAQVDGRACDLALRRRHPLRAGTRIRSRRERRYSSAKAELARGMRGAIWHSDAALDMMDQAFMGYMEAVQQRAARDGTAHNADKSVRFFFK